METVIQKQAGSCWIHIHSSCSRLSKLRLSMFPHLFWKPKTRESCSCPNILGCFFSLHVNFQLIDKTNIQQNALMYFVYKSFIISFHTKQLYRKYFKLMWATIHMSQKRIQNRQSHHAGVFIFSENWKMLEQLKWIFIHMLYQEKSIQHLFILEMLGKK